MGGIGGHCPQFFVMPQLNGFEFFNYIKFTIGNYLERPVDDPWGCMESLHSVRVDVILLFHGLRQSGSWFSTLNC
jgi:hypothetical protein